MPRQPRWRWRRSSARPRGPCSSRARAPSIYHPVATTVEARATFLNLRRFLSLDLTYGRHVSAPIYQYLNDNGLARDEYDWFMRAGPRLRRHCILGTDYYRTNEQLVHPDGHIHPVGEVFGYYVVMKEYYDRYHLPVMHTETNFPEPDGAGAWLWTPGGQRPAAAAGPRPDRRLHLVRPDRHDRLGRLPPRGRWPRQPGRPVRPRPPGAPRRPAFRDLVRDYGHLEAWESGPDDPGVTP